MNTLKRKTVLIIIALISALSIHQFIDVYSKFRFLLIDILNNISQSVVGYMIFIFLISITSFLAFIFNWKLLKTAKYSTETDLIDMQEKKYTIQFGLFYFGYLIFGGILTGLGFFLIIKPIQENYPIAEFPNGLSVYILAILIIGAGTAFIFDGWKIKRAVSQT